MWLEQVNNDINERIDEYHHTKSRKSKLTERVEVLEKRANNTDKIISNHEQRISKFETKKVAFSFA